MKHFTEQYLNSIIAQSGNNLEECAKLLNLEIQYAVFQGDNLAYVNTGDTYDLTICEENEDGALFLCSWGDWMEEKQNAHTLETGEISCAYCSEQCEVIDGAEWRETICGSCGHFPDGSKAYEWDDDDIETFIDSYIECALWSSTDNADDSGGAPLYNNYDESDLHSSARDSMEKECRAFIEEDIKTGWMHGLDPGQCGHDFWLTKNHHGAGFWDRGYGKIGDDLTKRAEVWGSQDIYIGDDGKLYIS